ncbi:N-acetyl-gamma-glutamyl-phosphate reductase [Bartonella sp. DGB2]|uniref:N-acetyl-gamma-glutamyl-phosphate reductase n=1 Tax=Bartonella sp. DGB2 TaxID=3388426 RepID=UPI00398FE44B
MTPKIFIDGEHGTTGLQIQKRLQKRQDIELLSIPHTARHEVSLRQEYLHSADISILCLPDEVASTTVTLLASNNTSRIIDTSTAHRTTAGWTYGLPELTKGQKTAIASAQRVANPGCYASGAIALIRPLREAGLLSDEYPINLHAISGYSGGGKQMIAQMENPQHSDYNPTQHFFYGLQLNHKHLAEIQYHGLLSAKPIFSPSVGRFAQGMIVHLPLHRRLFHMSASIQDIRAIFNQHYVGQNIINLATEEETLSTQRLNPESLAGKDEMRLFLFHDDKEGLFNFCAVFDNLGKGAAGAAVQNLDLMLYGS